METQSLLAGRLACLVEERRKERSGERGTGRRGEGKAVEFPAGQPGSLGQKELGQVVTGPHTGYPQQVRGLLPSSHPKLFYFILILVLEHCKAFHWGS